MEIFFSAEQESDKNKESRGQFIISLTRTPGSHKLNGALSKTNQLATYFKALHEVEVARDTYKCQSIVDFLKGRFNTMRVTGDDMAVISLAEGYHALVTLTGEVDKAHRHLKQLIRTCNKYNLMDPNTVLSALYYVLFVFYIYKKKLGNAQTCVRKCMYFMQNEAPSTWTASVYHLRAKMYDTFAHCYKSSREQCRKQAVESYKLALRHELELGDAVDWPLYVQYATNVLHLLLGIPTVHTIRKFRKSDIVLQHCGQFDVTESDMNEALHMRKSINETIINIDAGKQAVSNEYLQITDVYISMRYAQMNEENNKFVEASHHVLEALKRYEEWRDDNDQWQGSWYNMLPNLQTDLLSLLQNLESKINHKSSVLAQRKIVTSDSSNEASASEVSSESESKIWNLAGTVSNSSNDRRLPSTSINEIPRIQKRLEPKTAADNSLFELDDVTAQYEGLVVSDKGQSTTESETEKFASTELL